MTVMERRNYVNTDCLVSVVIPVYDSGRTLDRALVSVYYQTYKNIEIIVIDDGSTDKFTREKLKKLKNSEIKIIFQENGGPSKARNTGIKSSSGEYILPLDSDDFMHSKYIEECLKIITKNKNYSPIYCDTIIGGKIKGIEKRPEWCREKLIKGNFIVSCSMFSREAFDLSGGYDEKLKGWEDYDLWLRMMQKGYVGKRIPKFLFAYVTEKRNTAISTIANKDSKHLHMRILLKNGLIVDSEKKSLHMPLGIMPLDSDPLVHLESINDLTIICSNYNSSKWIDDYLESINYQLLNNFSIIFVDANSTDNSLNTIKKFEFRKGINVNVIEVKTKINIYEAWNLAIEQARSKFILNYNTDDRLFPGALLTLITAMLKHPEVDIAYANSLICEDEKHNIIKKPQTWPSYTHQELLKNCILGPFPIVKRSSIVENGLFNPKYSISGDYEMWLRLSKKDYKFLKLNDFIGTYYNNPKGVSTNPSSRQERLRQDLEIRRLYA